MYELNISKNIDNSHYVILMINDFLAIFKGIPRKKIENSLIVFIIVN